MDIPHICCISPFSSCSNNFYIINSSSWLLKLLQFKISLQLKYLLISHGVKIWILRLNIQKKKTYFNFLRKCFISFIALQLPDPFVFSLQITGEEALWCMKQNPRVKFRQWMYSETLQTLRLTNAGKYKQLAALRSLTQKLL